MLERDLVKSLVISLQRSLVPSSGFALSRLSSIIPAEMIATSFYQEDVATGLVPSWVGGGVNPKTASQASGPLQPSKLDNQRGVMFSTGTKHNLTWATENESYLLHRWWITIARSNVGALTAGQTANVFAANGNATSNTNRQPKVQFVNPNLMGSAIFDTASRNINVACTNDVEVWNVIVGYRRGFVHQAIVNGVAGTSQAFHSWLANNSGGTLSFFGDPTTNLNANVAIDCTIIGQGELTDDLIDKIVGWGMWRAGRPSDLPIGHPYRSAPPSGMANPTRYIHNAAAYAAWETDLLANRFVNRGLAAPAITGYSTVMFDDFVNPSVVSDSSAEGSNIWFAPTWLSGIGVFAGAQAVSASPSSYVHDAGATTMSLRLLYNSGWKTGAFASLTKNGQGRCWGKGIFEIKFKFRKNGVDGAIPAPRPGLFPAFWSYGAEHMFWITRNRLETDFWEYDGLDGSYINISQHVHVGNISFSDPGVVAPGPDRKIAGYPVSTATDPDFAGTIDIYDGNYHTYYMQIEDDYTYMVLDGEEIARCQTSAELAADKYILVDLAYDPAMGAAAINTADTYDMVIDYIKVQQKETQLAAVSAAFSARAAISGIARDGQTLSVTSNTTGSQIHYRWYRDGVPIVGAITNTYLLATADIGHKVRCYVQNLSLDTKPFSWTVESATVGIALPAAVIEGIPTIGQALWATGTAPYQWYRSGVAITSATSQGYLLVTADDGANITCIDASGLSSNTIVGTWVRYLQNGNAAILDIDRQNDRYWHNGTFYNRANFQALAWVPDNITSLISTTAWTSAGVPFPGFSASAGAFIGTATLTDANVDLNIVTFSDNTTTNFIQSQLRFQNVPAVGRLQVTTGNVSQAVPQSGAWLSDVQSTQAVGWNNNDCWFLGPQNGVTFDNTTPNGIPTVDRMRLGSNATGSQVATGSIERVTYFAGDVPLHDIQMLLGLDVITLDYGLGENDPVDAKDVFGDGFPAILNNDGTGTVRLYRQQQRNVFTKTFPSTATDLIEVEGICWLDYAGTGNHIIMLSDQNPGKIYSLTPNTPGAYTGAYTRSAAIRSDRPWIQDLRAITFPGDDRESLVYTWESNTNAAGGINKMRWDGAAWVDTQLVQHDGAFGISYKRFANGDLLFNARASHNPGAESGVFRMTLAGVETTIVADSSDWKMCSIGDFFGNGNEDVLAHIEIPGTHTDFFLFDSANAWAKTTVSVGKTVRYGTQNAGFKVNGREAVVVAGDTPAPYVEIWAWNGAAWALYRSLTGTYGAASFWKSDDPPAKMNIFRQSPGQDLVWGESLGQKLVAVRLIP